MPRRLLLLGGLAALAVVAHHATHWVVTGTVWWADRYQAVAVPDYTWIGTPKFLAVRLVDLLSTFAVPAFLFTSGYFISVVGGRSGRDLGWPTVLRRSLWLIIPYLVWSSILIILNSLNGQEYDVWTVARALLLGEAAPPYYYVPLAVQLFLLSVWLVPLTRFHAKAVLAVSAAVAGASLLVHYPIIAGVSTTFGRGWPISLDWWQLPLYAVWFVGGIAAQSNLPAFRRWLQPRRRWLLAGVVLTALLALVESELMRRAGGRDWLSPQATLWTNILDAFLILAFLAYEAADPPFAGQLRHLGTMSFGIYLMHVPILEVVSRGIAHVAPGLLALAGLMYFILIASGVGIPALAMIATRRSRLRPVYSFLFG